MTLSEYTLRVEGWKREQNRQLFRDRRTWYNTLVGPHWDPKKLPRSESAYLRIPEIDDDKPQKSSELKKRFADAVDKYNKEKAEQDGRADH